MADDDDSVDYYYYYYCVVAYDGTDALDVVCCSVGHHRLRWRRAYELSGGYPSCYSSFSSPLSWGDIKLILCYSGWFQYSSGQLESSFGAVFKLDKLINI